MKCQKNLFNLDEDVVYLNCATKSPALIDCKNAGHQAIEEYSKPYLMDTSDFFTPIERLKKTFAKIVDCVDYERLAIIPSVSYGVANVIKNIPFKKGDNIVVPDGQFPSNIYPWQEAAKEHGLELRIISPPDTLTNRGSQWNEKILEAIDEKTIVLAISHVLWSDGTLFDLVAMRERTRQVDAYLIVDGTQSIGAMDFSIKDIKPDALLCAGYKWLLGPYSLGIAYYSEKFDNGIPIEDNWMTRVNSDKFAELVNYQDEYRPKAYRYSVGESSNFILVPMLQKALDQILDWGVDAIQDYTKSISTRPIELMRSLGVHIEEDNFRSHHLFGLWLPDSLDQIRFASELKEKNIFVSLRGDVVRVAPHVYSTEEDLMALAEAVRKAIG